MDSNKLQTKITKLEKRLKRVEEYIDAFKKHNEFIQRAITISDKNNEAFDRKLMSGKLEKF